MRISVSNLVSACVSAALLAACGSQTLVRSDSQLALSPCGQSCFYQRFHVLPRKHTIKLGEHITLHDEYRFCLEVCRSWYEVDARWHSSGGSLKVIDAGKKAVFSASAPGVYRVNASYVGMLGPAHARATVTVTSSQAKDEL
jgi:hypothetical protein